MSDPLQATRRTTAFRGALLTVGMRWADRLLGLASTLVLARLLLPEDFGLVAMAMVVAGFVDVLLDLGVSAALVQNTQADKDDFNTAWTLRLLQAAVAASVMVATSGLVADYYGDERVAPILLVVAVTALIGGLENIGTVSFQKNMEFGRDFQFFVYKRLIAVTFAIGVAFALRSYWALVIGGLIARIAGVAISYRLSAFRPRLSLSRFSAIWSFSQWNVVSAVGSYLAASISRFIVGKRTDATVMGGYSVGEEIAVMPTTELLAPLGRVMFPVFAAAKHDAAELLRVVRLALSIQALLAIPAGVGVALVARDAIPLLLGDNWTIAATYAEIIGLATIALALCHSAIYLLQALGLMRKLAGYNWAKVAMLVLLTVVIFPSVDARGIALCYLGTAFGGLVVIQYLARQALPTFSSRVFLDEVWRPLVATAAMAGAVWLLSRQLSNVAPLTRLAACMIMGATTYTLFIFLLWRAAGSPVGAETYLLEKLKGSSQPRITSRQ